MAKARPSSSEIDRFLEEVNRRKQQQARQSAPPPVVQRELPKPRMQPPPPRPVKVQQKQFVMDEPVVRAVVVESLPEPPREIAPKPTASAYQIPAAPPPLPRGTVSAPVQHAQALLKSRDGLRAMFVMNEILSPPRSKRAYRR